jgi:hypothetical protein
MRTLWLIALLATLVLATLAPQAHGAANGSACRPYPPSVCTTTQPPAPPAKS